MARTDLEKRARKIRELATDRRVIARRLPMDATLAGALGTCLIFAPKVAGFWVFFAFAALLTVGDLITVIRTTAKLRGTSPEERGKRSDDKALAQAQNTLGCLGFLLIATTGAVVVFWAYRGTWPWQPWVVALGGGVGQASGIAVIAWSRRAHRSSGGPEQWGAPDEVRGRRTIA